MKLEEKKLDALGKGLGIIRYQGLGAPENDDEYRKNILNELWPGEKIVKEKAVPETDAYVVVLTHWDGEKIDPGICWDGTIIACYDHVSPATKHKENLDNKNKKGVYIVCHGKLQLQVEEIVP